MKLEIYTYNIYPMDPTEKHADSIDFCNDLYIQVPPPNTPPTWHPPTPTPTNLPYPSAHQDWGEAGPVEVPSGPNLLEDVRCGMRCVVDRLGFTTVKGWFAIFVCLEVGKISLHPPQKKESESKNFYPHAKCSQRFKATLRFFWLIFAETHFFEAAK